MSDRPRYIVTFIDGREVEAEGRTSDIIAFERRFSLPGFLLGDPDTFRIEHQCFMGYQAVTRGWADRPEFDDWLEDVDSVVLVGNDDADAKGDDKTPLAPTA